MSKAIEKTEKCTQCQVEDASDGCPYCEEMFCDVCGSDHFEECKEEHRGRER